MKNKYYIWSEDHFGSTVVYIDTKDGIYCWNKDCNYFEKSMSRKAFKEHVANCDIVPMVMLQRKKTVKEPIVLKQKRPIKLSVYFQGERPLEINIGGNEYHIHPPIDRRYSVSNWEIYGPIQHYNVNDCGGDFVISLDSWQEVLSWIEEKI